MNGRAITQRPHVAPDRWEAAVCSWPDNEARGWARDLMQAARQNGTVNAVVATGSAVRDVDRSDDLDLVLVYHAARPSLPRPPISVDLRCYDQADVSARLTAGHSYLSWAVRFGRDDGGNQGGPERKRAMAEIRSEAAKHNWRIFKNQIPFSRGFPKMMRGDYNYIGNARMFYHFEQELRRSLSEEGYLS